MQIIANSKKKPFVFNITGVQKFDNHGLISGKPSVSVKFFQTLFDS